MCSSSNGESHVEDGKLFFAFIELHHAPGGVESVKHGDDLLEGSAIVTMHDRLIELLVAGIAVATVLLPLRLELRGKFGVPNDRAIGVVGFRYADFAHDRCALLPDESEIGFADVQIQHFFRRLRSQFLVGVGGPGDLSIRIHA